MIGEIIKIIPPVPSRNKDTSYARIEFTMEDGAWMKTDVCRAYRNYWRWKRVMRIGNKVEGLVKWNENTIDADSDPRFVSGRLVGSGAKYTLQELRKTEDQKLKALCQELSL